MDKEIISSEWIENNAWLIFRADFYPIYSERYWLWLSTDEKLILSFIHYWTKNGQWIYATNLQIAMLIESSESTAKRCLKSLKEKWFVSIVEKRTQTGTDRKLRFNKVSSQSLAQFKNELSAGVKLTCAQGSNWPAEKNDIEKNKIDISKDISANANSEQNHATESKLVETVQWDEMPIDENELWSAYKCATSRKGKIEDVKKVVKNFSQSEMKAALLELRILTFEFRMGIVDIMRCNTCANAIKNRTNDESLIIDRIENIVNKFKTHKCKTDKIKDERSNEIKTYFKDYLSYTKEKEPTTKEEWIQLYEKYASAWTPYKIKEDYPKCDFAKIKEDWIMRNINWRK